LQGLAGGEFGLGHEFSLNLRVVHFGHIGFEDGDGRIGEGGFERGGQGKVFRLQEVNGTEEVNDVALALDFPKGMAHGGGGRVVLRGERPAEEKGQQQNGCDKEEPAIFHGREGKWCQGWRREKKTFRMGSADAEERNAGNRNRKELNHKERKDHKELDHGWTRMDVDKVRIRFLISKSGRIISRILHPRSSVSIRG
jgi:hypothetical protein